MRAPDQHQRQRVMVVLSVDGSSRGWPHRASSQAVRAGAVQTESPLGKSLDESPSISQTCPQLSGEHRAAATSVCWSRGVPRIAAARY